MKITNNAPFPVVAFGWHTQVGYGNDVLINPGETGEVNGPYVGEMGDGVCHIALLGGVTCQEGPDDDKGMQIGPGLPISCAYDDRGFTIRHSSEPPEDFVTTWRRSRSTL